MVVVDFLLLVAFKASFQRELDSRKILREKMGGSVVKGKFALQQHFA